MSFLVSDAYAQSAGGGLGGGFDILLLILPMFAIMYFLVIRPQQKRAKEHKQLVETLGRGDRIVTQGGLIGSISKVYDDGHLDMEFEDGSKIQIVKEAVASVTEKKSKPKAANSEKAASK